MRDDWRGDSDDTQATISVRPDDVAATMETATLTLIDELNTLCSQGAEPRVHGNGFVQLDVDPKTRLHFWGHAAIPRQRVYTGIHDHVYSFHSTVLLGRLINLEWRLEYVDNGPYMLHAVSRESRVIVNGMPNEDTKLVSTGNRVRTWNPKIEVLYPGDSYTMFPQDFHESLITEPTITRMVKGESKRSIGARILVPIGEQPDNTFNRHAHDAARLWNIVYELANLVKP